MLKILTVIGARPQFIKAATISRYIKNYNRDLNPKDNNYISEKILHTGQHYDENMSKTFFEELDIPSPDIQLSISNLQHSLMTSRMLESIYKVLDSERPDLVLLYGDTNSTLAGALASVQNKIPTAHVESGLRSKNHLMPEEINRVLTDRFASLLFCPTDTALNNLSEEGFPFSSIDKDKQVIKFSGDVMFDALMYYKDRAKKSEILSELSIDDKKLITCTLHRESNTGSDIYLNALFSSLNDIPEEYTVVFPVHPRLKKWISINKKHYLSSRIVFTEPLKYLEMQKLLISSDFVFTDSGGLQKEAYLHNVPCITLRGETEWKETVSSGWNILANPLEKNLSEYINPSNWSFGDHDSFYGDGNAAKIIVDTIIEHYC